MLNAVVVSESVLLFGGKSFIDKDSGAHTHCERPAAELGLPQLYTGARTTYDSSNTTEAIDSDLDM